jgi:hypothetical protein
MYRMVHRLAWGAPVLAALLGLYAISRTPRSAAALPLGPPLDAARSSAGRSQMLGESQAMEAEVAIAAPGQVHYCTIFYAADVQEVLGGNNEDWRNPLTKVWFLPAEKGKYGRMYVGFDNYYPQGGVNDQGLFFDATATPRKEAVLSKDRPVYGGILLAKMMEECATVEEALDLFGRYDLGFMEGAQFLIGDRKGASAVIEGDVILRSAGRFQVLTNFRQSEYGDGPYPCRRFTAATKMLAEAPEISVELFRDILDATHAGPPYPTQYSCIYDLKRGLVYLYHYHDFDHVVVLHLAEELSKGERFLDLPGLFVPQEAVQRAIAPAIEQYETRVAGQRTAGVDPQACAGLVGVYEAEGTSVGVTRAGDGLYLRVEGQPSFELFPRAEAEFAHPFFDYDLRVSFERDQAGEVTGLTLRLYGREFRLRKAAAGGHVPWWAWLAPLLFGAAAFLASSRRKGLRLR